ncbi:putative ASST-domain-containing protein [Seiridium cardinale]|uniref:ASST-domain-containing protein n=1 Tax=Seiridium cardinale TaxID=138064 RepID=A0ABR2Y2T6_9PEZI
MLGSLLYFLGYITFAFRFAVADEFKHDYEAYNNAKFGIYPDNRHKGTRTKSPVLQITTWDKDAVSKSGSHIFLRHNGKQDTWGNQQASPLILDANDLTAVYINRSFPLVFNVRVQENYGKKYLTFYGDKLVANGLGDGFCHVYDTSYREVYKVGAQYLKVKADLHECELTGHGTVIVTAYETGRSRAPPGLASTHTTLIRESIFQEIDLETNKALFTWRASEHVDIYDSYEGHNSPWDFFHINTIEKTADGNYLVSARHMHSIYLVNGQTGDVMWTMGGQKNEFVELPPEDGVLSSNPVLTFAWQHHTRFYNNGKNNGENRTEMTFFDNHQKDHNEYGCTANCSRGLHVRLDTESNPKTVQLIQEYQHPAGLLSQSQGSMQILDNGNAFIGWGRNPSFTEHTPDGKAVLDVQFSPWLSKATADHALDNYRAYKQDWAATPYWPPEVAAKTYKDAVTAYVSWNGATKVKGWVLVSIPPRVSASRWKYANLGEIKYASDSEDGLTSADSVVARVSRSGFETEVPLGHLNASYLRAEAINRHNTVIGSTGILGIKSGKMLSMESALSLDIDDSDDVDFSELNLEAWDFSREATEWRTTLVSLLRPTHDGRLVPGEVDGNEGCDTHGTTKSSACQISNHVFGVGRVGRIGGMMKTQRITSMTRTIANEKNSHGHQVKSKRPANAPPTMDPEGAHAPKSTETMTLRISSGYAEPNMARPFDIVVAGPMPASTRANTNMM